MSSEILLSFLLIISSYLIGDNVFALEAIINGDKAAIDTFTYQVSIKLAGREHQCGGGIIAPQFVLTAAHCITKDDGQFYKVRMQIVVGTNNLLRKRPPIQTVDIDRLYVPTEYKSGVAKVGDIAVLKLKRPLVLSKHVSMLRLPSNKNDYFSGEIAKISGFGWYYYKIEDGKEHGGNDDKRLRYAETRVMSPEECRENYHDSKMSMKKLCAQMIQRDVNHPSGVCDTDSGGPLVVDSDLLIGILSASENNCSEKYFAAIYTRVSYYLTFIHNAMNHKIDKYIRTFPK